MDDLLEALDRVNAAIDTAADLPTLIGMFAVRASLRAQIATLSGEARWLAR